MALISANTSHPAADIAPSRVADLTVTILICTSHRGESIAATIRSILDNIYTAFTLIVVDQSSDLHTQRAVEAFHDEPRLRYVHTSTRGKSLALNIGLALATGDLVLLTDDDCEVPPNWIAEMARPFLHSPEVGVVFCDVAAGPHNPQLGWVPVSISPRPVHIPNLAGWQTCDGVNIGIGAGMAFRRSVAESVGGFSPLFGPGSRFRSGDDLEFTLRTLIAGHQIYRISHVEVIHHGFRTFDEGRQLIRRNMFGVGAIYGQLIRRGRLFALHHYAAVFAAMVVRPALKELSRRRTPRVLGRAIWLLRGVFAGLRLTPPPRTPGLRGLPPREG